MQELALATLLYAKNKLKKKICFGLVVGDKKRNNIIYLSHIGIFISTECFVKAE